MNSKEKRLLEKTQLGFPRRYQLDGEGPVELSKMFATAISHD